MGGGLAVEVEGALGSEGAQGDGAGGAGRERGHDEGKRGDTAGGEGTLFSMQTGATECTEERWELAQVCGRIR